MKNIEFLRIVRQLDAAPNLKAMIKDLEMATKFHTQVTKVSPEQAQVDLFDDFGNFMIQVVVGSCDNLWDIEDVRSN